MRQEEKNALIKQIANVIDQLSALDSEHQVQAKAALAQAIAAIGEVKVEKEETLPAWKIINYSLVQGEVAKGSSNFVLPKSFSIDNDNDTWGVNNAFHWGETFYNKDDAAIEYINHLNRMRENLQLISRSSPARADRLEPTAIWIWAKDEITFVPVVLFRGTDLGPSSELNLSAIQGCTVIPVGNGLLYKPVNMKRNKMFPTLFDAMKQ